MTTEPTYTHDQVVKMLEALDEELLDLRDQRHQVYTGSIAESPASGIERAAGEVRSLARWLQATKDDEAQAQAKERANLCTRWVFRIGCGDDRDLSGPQDAYVDAGLLEAEVDEDDELLLVYTVNPDVQEGWPAPLEFPEIELVAYYERLVQKPSRTAMETLAVIHYMLSCPVWPASLIEDVREELNRCDDISPTRVPWRLDISGAQWPRH